MPSLSRRRFFSGLSGFAAVTCLNVVLAGRATPGLSRASIVACGGGGCNVLAGMARRMAPDIDLFAIDAHAKHPELTPDLQAKFASHRRVRTLTVSRPEIELLPYLGDHSLDELAWPRDELEPLIAKLIETGRPVVVLTCLGGQTGSLAANAVASACHNAGLAVQAVASTPFDFEAKRATRIALTNLTRLARHADGVHALPNRLIRQGLENSPKIGPALARGNALLARQVTTALGG